MTPRTLVTRLLAASATVTLSITILAGCAPANPATPATPDQETPMTQGATLETAKSATEAVRDEVLALVPAESVAEVQVVEEATLMDCQDGAFAWPGSATVITTGEWNSEEFLGAVLGAFDGRDGWEVTDSIAAEQMVKAVNADGLQIFTSVVKDGGEIWVRAFSTCFEFDPQIGKKY